MNFLCDARMFIYTIKAIHSANANMIAKNLKKSIFLNTREWPYKGITPRIIAEKYMVDESNVELKDYKFFCFQGQAKFIQVDFGRFNKHRRNIYDTKWNLQDFQIKYPNDPKFIIEKPLCLDKMIEYSNCFSQNIPFLRVDFYSIGSSIYFGEFTFFHGSGTENFMPDEWDMIFGDFLDLPNINYI